METSGVVVALGAPSIRWPKLQFAINMLLLIGWGWQAVTTHKTIYVVLTVLAAVAVALYTWAIISAPRIALALVSDRIELRRRFRPLSVNREDVVAVRGNVPGRPTWSEQVLVETRGGMLRLPPLDRPPAEVIAQLLA